MTPELEIALADLDLRAMLDPRLEVYRVAPGQASLRRIPRGWTVSQDMVHLAEHGGWWPGYFFDFDQDGAVLDWFDASGNRQERYDEHTIQWAAFATVHDRDHCYTPITRTPQPTAPVFMFSSQALWSSMTFATEAAMLRAFIITYDEIGWDEESASIETMFVDWMLEPPEFHVTPQQLAAHKGLKVLTQSTTTTHPCWDEEHMPFYAPEAMPPIATRFFGLG